VKITGANFDSSSMDKITQVQQQQQRQYEVPTTPHVQQQLSQLPMSEYVSSVTMKSGSNGGEDENVASDDVIQGGEGVLLLTCLDQESTTTTITQRSASESITTSSTSDDDTDDEDFLDLLANTLDGEFDLDLVF
jgi:hypothetical protein